MRDSRATSLKGGTHQHIGRVQQRGAAAIGQHREKNECVQRRSLGGGQVLGLTRIGMVRGNDHIVPSGRGARRLACVGMAGWYDYSAHGGGGTRGRGRREAAHTRAIGRVVALEYFGADSAEETATGHQSKMAPRPAVLLAAAFALVVGFLVANTIPWQV